MGYIVDYPDRLVYRNFNRVEILMGRFSRIQKSRARALVLTVI